jgi:GGDEF domain-containing protein
MSEDIFDFVGTEDWFNQPKERQQQALDIRFDEIIAKNPKYIESDDRGKADIKQAYIQKAEERAWNSPYNPSEIRRRENQKKAKYSTFLGNTLTKALESHDDAFNRLPLVDDALYPDGQIDQNAGAQLSKVFQKRREHIVTNEQLKLGKDVDVMLKKWDKGDAWDKTKAVGEFITKLPENAGGIIQVGAESLSSMSIMAAGAKTGAEVGGLITAASGGAAAPVIPVTTAMGMIAAEMGDAGVQKFVEGIEGELDKRGLPPTTSNINMLLQQNPILIEALQKKDIAYGGTLALVDTFLGGVFSRMSTLATRSARQTALKNMTSANRTMLTRIAKQTGKGIKDLEEDFINGSAAAILKNRSLKRKVGSHTLSYLGEVAGEPISEAAATSAAGEKNTAKNLLYEALGGVGTGPIGASINTAAMGSKLAKNKTGDVLKEALRTKGTEEQQAKAINKSKNARGFKKDVEETNPDSDISHLTDPASEQYDPIKAVNILEKSNQEDAHDKALEISKTYTESVLKNIEEFETLQKKQAEEGSLSKEEVARANELQKITDIQMDTLGKINASVGRLNKKLNANAQEEIKDIDVETANPDEAVEEIVKSLGSHGSKNVKTNKDIDAFLARKDVTEEQKRIPKAIKQYNVATSNLQKTIDTSGKSMSQVHNDVRNGIAGSHFKGITAYHRAIKQLVAAGNTKAALKQIDGLRAFTESHKHKAKVLNQVFNAAVKKEALSPEVQKQYDELKQKNKNLNIHAGSGALIDVINEEVNTLEAGLKLAESLAPSKQTQQPPASSNTSPKNATTEQKVNALIQRIKQGNFRSVSAALKSKNVTPEQKSAIKQAMKEANKAQARKNKKNTPKKKANLGEKLAQKAQQISNKESKPKKDRRKKVREMSMKELQETLLQNELTGIPNRRAYDESSKGKVQVSVDGDSLKWVNDNMTHEAGNDMLKGIATVLHSVFSKIDGVDAYHVSGDEYIVQGNDVNAVLDGLKKVEEILSKQVIEVTLENNDKIKLNGLNITYAVNTEGNLNEADRKLAEEKERKQREGQRAARGEKPPNAQITKSSESKNKESEVPVKSEQKNEGASRRKMAVSAHDTTWNTKGFNYDKRLHDLRVFELLTGFFESQATQGKVKNIAVDAGNGMGGTKETVVDGSINPDWVKQLYKDYETNYKGVVRAVNKALEARIKPTDKQSAIVTAVIDAAIEAMEESGSSLDQLDKLAIDEWNQEHGIKVETQESTETKNTDTVPPVKDTSVDNLEEYEDVDLGELYVTLDDGTQKTYNEVMATLNDEITAYEKLKECLTIKG